MTKVSARPEFRLLGHLEVGGDDLATSLGGPRQRALLAYLLLHAGEVVSTERLVKAVWGNEPPPTAHAIVYGYIRKLRAALESTSATLITKSSGYVLELRGGSLDVSLFERMSGQGREALRNGDAATARQLLGDALSLWRGRALDGLEGDGFLHAEQSRLESLRVATRLDRVEADLRLGGPAIEELRSLAIEHPLNEEIRRKLMLVLYRAGNQAEALAVYHDIRRSLADELGLDPSRMLQELESAILRQDPSLDIESPTPPGQSAPRGRPAPTTGAATTGMSDTCPFVGLTTFGVGDAQRFFGRERLVADAIGQLATHRFLGIVGASGSGKSSLLRAGIVPAIASGAIDGSGAWIRILIRPGTDPMRELDRAVFAALDEPRRAALSGVRDPVSGALEVLPESARVCLIVDQFEEVFASAVAASERLAFIASLVEAAESQRATVLIALRADFYGACAEHRRLADLLASSQVLVGPMTADEYRQAIEGPARQAGLQVESALVERLVADVADEPGALPLLSAALVELWERRDGRTMRIDAIEATGGVSGAVTRLAESAFGQLTGPEQAVARIAFLRLAGGHGALVTRRRVALDEFDATTNEDMRRALAVLTAARLLTLDGDAVEVAHEALLREWPRLDDWLDDDRDGRRIRAHLSDAAQEWERNQHAPADLYRGARLASVVAWADEHEIELNDLERRFLHESRLASEAEARRQRQINRRLRLLLVGTAAALVLAGGAGAIAVLQRADAERATAAADQQRVTAEQQRVAAQAAARTADAERLSAQALVTKDLGLSLLLARQAVALDDSPTTRANLIAAVDRSPAAIGIWHPLPGRLLGITASDDGKTLLVTNNGGQSAAIDAATGHTRFVYDWHADTVNVSMASNGDVLVVGSGPALTLLDPTDGHVAQTIDYPRDGSSISWAPDLKTLAVTADDARSISVVDASTKRTLRTLIAPSNTWISPLNPTSDVVLLGDGEVLAPLVPGPPPGQPVRAPNDPGSMAVAIWGPGASATVRTISFSTTAPRSLVNDTVSPDGQTLMLGNVPGPGQAALVDLATGRIRQLPGQQAGLIQGSSFSPDGSIVATGSDDLSVHLWDVASGSLRDTFLGHAGRVFGPAFRQVGGELTAYTVSLDGSMIAWDVTGDRRLGKLFQVGTGLARVTDQDPQPQLALSPDGRLIAASEYGGVAIIDEASRQLIRDIRTAEAGGNSAVAWSPDGSRLAVTGIGTGIVELFDTATWRSVRGPLAGPPQYLAEGDLGGKGRRANFARTVAFSPDSQKVVAGTEDGTIWTWNGRTGEPSGAPIHFSGPVYALAFDPTNGWLAAAANVGGGGEAAVFAPGDEVPRYTVSVDDGYGRAGAVVFSPDGTLLATGGGTGDIRFWDAASGTESGRSVPTSAGWVLDLSWSPSGDTLVSSGTDGTVRVVDVKSRSVASVLPGLDNTWVAAAMDPVAQRLVVEYATGQAFDWTINPDDWARQACTVAGRSLTQDEWNQYLPTIPFDPACRP